MVRRVASEDTIFHEKERGGTLVIAANPKEIQDMKQKITGRLFFILLLPESVMTLGENNKNKIIP